MQTTETWTYTCLVSNVTADFTNTASVLADEPGGGTVDDADSASVFIAVPGLSIDKTPDEQTINIGGDANFNLLVQNIGPLSLGNVQVADPDCDPPILFISGDGNGDSLLQPDETWAYACTVAGVTADFTNNASVTADDPGGGVLQSSDSATVTVVDNPRVQADLKVLYTFAEESGDRVNDVSNILPALDLTIQDTGAVTWIPGGGLSVDSPTVLLSAGAADKIIAGSKTTGEITLEAWIRPAIE